jgi:hypothetical protein
VRHGNHPALSLACTLRRWPRRIGGFKILSDPDGIVEYMFEQAVSAVVERLGAAARAESQAAGQRLAAIGELDLLWLRRFGERETWCTDSQDAITAELAAALNITQALAASHLYYSRAMRLQLARVGERLLAGDIDYRTLSHSQTSLPTRGRNPP